MKLSKYKYCVIREFPHTDFVILRSNCQMQWTVYRTAETVIDSCSKVSKQNFPSCDNKFSWSVF